MRKLLCRALLTASLLAAWTAPSLAAETEGVRAGHDLAPLFIQFGRAEPVDDPWTIMLDPAHRPCLPACDLDDEQALDRPATEIADPCCCCTDGEDVGEARQCWDGWQCGAAIVGGAILGGLGGAGAGATAGAAIAGLGAIPGAVGGGLAGILGGALAGYGNSSACSSQPSAPPADTTPAPDFGSSWSSQPGAPPADTAPTPDFEPIWSP
jgi:hypothetical protein